VEAKRLISYFIRVDQAVVSPTGRAEPARSNAKAAADGAKDGAVSREIAEGMIARVADRLSSRLPGVLFQVVKAPESLPKAICVDATKEKVRNSRGVYYDSFAYLVLSSHKTAKEVEETVFHELYGHAAGINPVEIVLLSADAVSHS
jgi:hypothetical protein